MFPGIPQGVNCEGQEGISPLPLLTAHALDELPQDVKLRRMVRVQIQRNVEASDLALQINTLPRADPPQSTPVLPTGHVTSFYSVYREKQTPGFLLRVWESWYQEGDRALKRLFPCATAAEVLALLQAFQVPLDGWERIGMFPDYHYIYGLEDPFTRRIHYIGASAKPQRRIPTRGDRQNEERRKWLRELDRRGFSAQLVLLEIVPPEADGEQIRKTKRAWIETGFAAGWPLTNRKPTLSSKQK